MSKAERLAYEVFTDEGLKAASDAIKRFETLTSGEIVISFNTRSHGQPYKRAQRIFAKRGLHRTAQRNAILIAFFLEDKTFAIYGDKGIHEKVPLDYWEKTVQEMTARFQSGDLSNGLVWGIKELGNRLSEFFPYEADDENELSDDLHFEEE